MGQTAETEIRCKEHLHPFGSNNTNSEFAQHLLENDHALGKMDDVMEIMYFTEKVEWIP
jgi:hypothetical protein